MSTIITVPVAWREHEAASKLCETNPQGPKPAARLRQTKKAASNEKPQSVRAQRCLDGFCR